MERNGKATIWAAICTDFHPTKLLAADYGLGDRWHALVQSTLDGEPRLTEWTAFMADIEACVQSEEDLDGRNGDQVGPTAAPSRHFAPEGGLHCPRGLCDRRAPVSSFGEPPRCDLFNQPMTPG